MPDPTTPVTLPDRLKEILESRAFAHLTTIDPDGSPQSTAMWIMHDGDRILFNTAERRRKWRNLGRDPRLSVSISHLDDPYENWSIQGRVVEMRTSDGNDVIDALARKYLDGVDKYPWHDPKNVRVTVVVEPTRVAVNR
jgi:PPOX class probable F420-dependent enzyme